jgi:endogenous inhibitor of DNA gyrase (YacG/DUF329 family)
MSDPYRDSGIAASIDCPRCNKRMPPGALAACSARCGVWVDASIAAEALMADERRPSRLTSWARERVGCPRCGTPMTLRGHDMTLFQGCDDHGFWIDAEIVGQTGLGRHELADRLAAARKQAAAMTAHEERAKQAARDEAAERARERDEAMAAAREALEEKARASRREQAERAAAMGPFLKAARQIAHDPEQLAEILVRLDRQVAALTARVADLERELRR